jgi:putative solute:sodium symporter small subunit
MTQPNTPEPVPAPASPEAEIRDSLDRYWVSNVRMMAVLKLLWAVAGLGCGVFAADWLNQCQLPGTGYPLGFWFAQQGSIVAFVLLILVYCLLMNRLDRKHHRELTEIRERSSGKEVR